MKIAPLATLVLAASIATVSAQTADTAVTATTTTTAPTAAAADPVGISAREGITLSGTDVLVTRNGVSETLKKELSLPNGLRVQPNGTVLTADGGSLPLRPGQVLTFDGKFTPPGGAAATTTVTPATAAPATSTTTVTTPAANSTTATTISPAAANDISAAEAQRRARAASEPAK